ncbi:hypothetical protein [Flaviaesturariibacter aridisoli]|uniref:Uncharacterized protein n=1 Tax=Flaviaesturariibacter aridisoli TaxID=2545761 RepID=A0A4R4DVA5_9BACT|nr:hypothetical protein [Flaviaesturariibacter aridisoli]TCZ67348.1 hypothetical protein E0486_15700 [Flaviaesturariibacter aridisoli]
MSEHTGNQVHNQQTRGHQEGQMQNTRAGNSNRSQGLSDIQPGQQQVSSEQGASGETESDRANRNEDEGVRGGNSSI